MWQWKNSKEERNSRANEETGGSIQEIKTARLFADQI